MGSYDSTITIDGNTLTITDLTPRRVPSTYKQSLGKRLIKIKQAFPNAWDWELEMTLILSGSDRESIRDNLYTIFEGVSAVSYVDGKHDGTYFIESLIPNDTSDNPLNYVFSIHLTQKNQV